MARQWKSIHEFIKEVTSDHLIKVNVSYPNRPEYSIKNMSAHEVYIQCMIWIHSDKSLDAMNFIFTEIENEKD
jgi:dihydroorotate dehydrogenase